MLSNMLDAINRIKSLLLYIPDGVERDLIVNNLKRINDAYLIIVAKKITCSPEFLKDLDAHVRILEQCYNRIASN